MERANAPEPAALVSCIEGGARTPNEYCSRQWVQAQCVIKRPEHVAFLQWQRHQVGLIEQVPYHLRLHLISGQGA
eukprot:1604456-Amphidinium_carterae.1